MERTLSGGYVAMTEPILYVRCHDNEQHVLVATALGTLRFQPHDPPIFIEGQPGAMRGLRAREAKLRGRVFGLVINEECGTLDLVARDGNHTLVFALGDLPDNLTDEFRNAVHLSNIRMEFWQFKSI